MRFAYAEPNLRDAVAAGGLKPLKLEKTAIRIEKAAPVQALLLVASA